jgi:hypothetical protein
MNTNKIPTWKKVQLWANERLRMVRVFLNTKPGNVLVYGNGTKYRVADNGSHVRLFPARPWRGKSERRQVLVMRRLARENQQSTLIPQAL